MVLEISQLDGDEQSVLALSPLNDREESRLIINKRELTLELMPYLNLSGNSVIIDSLIAI